MNMSRRKRKREAIAIQNECFVWFPHDDKELLDYCRVCFDVGVCEGRRRYSATCDDQAQWRNDWIERLESPTQRICVDVVVN